MIKKFDDFKKPLKLKILKVPDELKDIFDMLKKEMDLCSINDKYGESAIFYERVFSNCLLEFNNLTFYRVNFIESVRNHIKPSNTNIEATQQFKKLTNPSSIFLADMLKLITDRKDIKIIDIDPNFDITFDLLISNLFGRNVIPENRIKKMMNLKIEITE